MVNGNGRKVLLAGESWIRHIIHQKGFDAFTTTDYGEGHQWLSAALTASGFEVEHMPNHLAPDKFPFTVEELKAYSAVILSDIGSNNLLLATDTFLQSVPRPNRLIALRDYVAGGGGLVMVGGYLTFQGIDGRARYAGTPVEEALPVTMQQVDDRVECPQGVTPSVADASHPIAAGLPAQWPNLLGYNRIIAKQGATLVATAGDDPLIAAWSYGNGRSVAFASDCGPHWSPPDFVNWDGYATLWSQLVAWASGD